MKTVLAILLSTMLVSVAPFEYHTEATENPSDNKNVGAQNVGVQNLEPTQNLVPTEEKQTQEPESTVKKIHYVTTTAYSSTPDQTDDTPFITANGTRVRDGIIATNFLPFGAKVRFPDYSGDKVYTVTDRMNKRFSDRADIWFETREQAMNFGIRKLKMEVL